MKKIRVPILNDEYGVYVVWGEDVKKIEKWTHWHFDDKAMDTYMETSRGRTFYRDGYMPVIWMNTKTWHEFAGTLAHEAVHAVDFIFTSIGEHNTRGELFAHAVGAIVRMVIDLRNSGTKLTRITRLDSNDGPNVSEGE